MRLVRFWLHEAVPLVTQAARVFRKTHGSL